jgi:Ca2+-binding EF-hand superfamily protein
MQHPDHPESPEGVLKSSDVRRCLISLNLGPPAREVPRILSTIDPLNTGFVPFLPFFEYAALAIHSKSEEDEEGDDDEYEDQAPDAGELFAAYSLFTHGGPGPITVAHLRRVAKELREEVDDDVLKDMIVEANGGVRGKKKGDVGAVGFEEFESVMRRAGISFS